MALESANTPPSAQGAQPYRKPETGEVRNVSCAPFSPGRQAAQYGLLAAVALACGYLELLVPLPSSLTGIKLGLGNIVILVALERMGVRAALALMLIKVIASTLLFANMQMFIFSLAGGALSWAIMALAVRSGAFSPIAVSVLGGIAHNAGQLLAVCVLLSPQVALINAPILTIAGIGCGGIVGIAAHLVLRALPEKAFHA